MQAMHRVVSNTNPIISLLKIGKLHLVKELYDEIYIPGGVLSELDAGKDKAFLQGIISD